MPNRRTLSIFALAPTVLVAAWALTACGARAQPVAAASTTPLRSFTPWPECAKGAVDSAPPSSSPKAAAPAPDGGTAAENPHFDENHAYRMSAELAPENRAAGEASVRLIRPALEAMRKDRQFTEKDVRAVLARWDCGADNGLAVFSEAPQYKRVSLSFYNGHACVSAVITPQDVVTEVYGIYAEPAPAGPCVENPGGH
ncbi:hypothetical protein FNH09_08200 [Streptomyces adustus]|uniref:DUF3558 domain-containing protein n=1 Tax=Streptomyces adustus TaxID=1609272 RepID=A0A5N8V9G6_9ACTN|nr:hypothetical protein [Streptomyces adustus]MPY31282.1 hypothetical protein [Streptomyces adustus]